MRYTTNSSLFRFASPGFKIAGLGVLSLVLSAVTFGIVIFLILMRENHFISAATVSKVGEYLLICFTTFINIGISAVMLAFIVCIFLPDTARIQLMVKKGLFAYDLGNPLHLQENQRLPKVKCKKVGLGEFEITISATTATIEDLENVATSISSSLNKKKYMQYAVVRADVDMAYNHVTYAVEDVTVHKELIVNSVAKLTPTEPTKLIVQKGTYNDLTTSGSMLFAGKTRSGKTTGVISILIQALLAGRDEFGSEILVVDPKIAELSQLPHVVTMDKNGEATAVIDAIKHFADTIVARQKILNDLSVQSGDAVKWWDAGMHVSVLFIDEYVSLRSMLPKRTAKDATDYNVDTFDALIKRIVTMGASAGCYVIISIAEASVGEGGLPQMLKNAMSTKVLFKPTRDEGRHLWDSVKLDNLPARTYVAGDAWFSSTDGINDNVTFVHFPVLRFKPYRALGKLLQAYYNDL